MNVEQHEGYEEYADIYSELSAKLNEKQRTTLAGYMKLHRSARSPHRTAFLRNISTKAHACVFIQAQLRSN